MKPTLITGSTGFLGRHLVEQLLARGGGPLRLLCRGAPPAAVADDPRVEIVRGDVLTAQDVDRAVAGARRVFHLAGVVSRDPADAEKLQRLHVEGTRLILEAAIRHRSGRVVVASSSGTVAVSRTAVAHNEESGYKEHEVARWPYYVAKIAEEKLALSYADRVPVVVVNPSLLLGPGDERCSSTGDVVQFLEGQVLSCPTGGVNFVDVRDCAAGVIAAMEKGRPGERYLLAGPNWTCRQFVAMVARLSGRRPPAMSSPAWLSLLSAPLLRRVLPLIERKFEIDDTTIEMSALYWYCDSSKARAELGFSTRDPEETLRDTLEDIWRRRPELRGGHV